MDQVPNEYAELLEAFLKSTQYIVRLKTQQDVWEHVGKLVVTQFPADWVAFGEREPQGAISVHHCTSSDPSLAQKLAGEEVDALVGDVLESGFLTSRVILAPTRTMVAFLPIIEGYQTKGVMLIGCAATGPMSNDLLNVYLAVAGLVGTALERLHSEQELIRHRGYLEELVGERTRELMEAQQQNDLILDCVGEGICGLDLEGRITFVNPFAARMVGWHRTELIGRDAHSTFHHSHAGGGPYPAEECPVQAHLSTQRAVQVSEEEFFRKDGSSFPVDLATAPITKEGRTIGAVLVFRDITERKSAEQERERLLTKEQELREELAALNEELHAQNEELAFQGKRLETQNDELRVAQEETARLLEEQSYLFQRLQEALLDIPSELAGVKFGHLYRSATLRAQVGGDFYDVFAARHGRVALLIGDVSGHGVEAARIASLVKDTVHAFAHQFRRPHLVLRETNRLLVEKKMPGFVTAFLGLLDPETGGFVYSSAGHPSPLLAMDGRIVALESVGTPLGVFEDARYRDRETAIDEGGLLLFYTDGVIEARRDDGFFGEERLTEALARLREQPVELLPSLLLDEALRFSGGRLVDDAALLAVNYLGKSGATRAEPASPSLPNANTRNTDQRAKEGEL